MQEVIEYLEWLGDDESVERFGMTASDVSNLDATTFAAVESACISEWEDAWERRTDFCQPVSLHEHNVD